MKKQTPMRATYVRGYGWLWSSGIIIDTTPRRKKRQKKLRTPFARIALPTRQQSRDVYVRGGR